MSWGGCHTARSAPPNLQRRVEAQDERRQAETKLTTDQLARIEQNRLRALEIRAQRAVERSTLAKDVRGSLAVV